MQTVGNVLGSRRLQTGFLGIADSTPSVPKPGGPWWSLRWLGCHGGAGVNTLLRLTGIGHHAGTVWPSEQGGVQVPVVLVCRASGIGTARAATAIQQWREGRGLRHIRLLGLAVVAASPQPVPARISQRLLLMAGWTRHQWWIGWQDDYLAADDPRTVGPSPDLVRLREQLVKLLDQADVGPAR